MDLSLFLVVGIKLPAPVITDLLIELHSPKDLGPSNGRGWTCIAGFWDLQTTSFEILWFLGYFGTFFVGFFGNPKSCVMKNSHGIFMEPFLGWRISLDITFA